MTINYRRSVNGSNDQLGRKYFSDSLTPYWATWGGLGNCTLSMSYTGLPISDALGKVIATTTIAAGCYFRLIFPQPPKLMSDYLIELWIKSSAVNGEMIFFFDVDGGVNFVPGTLKYTMWAVGLAPLIWTNYKMYLPSSFVKYGGGTQPGGKIIGQAIDRYFTFFNASPATLAGQTYEVAGFNIRRL